MKSFDIKTKIYFGDNAIERLRDIPYKRILIITDIIRQGDGRRQAFLDNQFNQT